MTGNIDLRAGDCDNEREQESERDLAIMERSYWT